MLFSSSPNRLVKPTVERRVIPTDGILLRQVIPTDALDSQVIPTDALDIRLRQVRPTDALDSQVIPTDALVIHLRQVTPTDAHQFIITIVGTTTLLDESTITKASDYHQISFAGLIHRNLMQTKNRLKKDSKGPTHQRHQLQPQLLRHQLRHQLLRHQLQHQQLYHRQLQLNYFSHS